MSLVRNELAANTRLTGWLRPAAKRKRYSETDAFCLRIGSVRSLPLFGSVHVLVFHSVNAKCFHIQPNSLLLTAMQHNAAAATAVKLVLPRKLWWIKLIPEQRALFFQPVRWAFQFPDRLRTSTRPRLSKRLLVRSFVDSHIRADWRIIENHTLSRGWWRVQRAPSGRPIDSSKAKWSGGIWTVRWGRQHSTLINLSVIITGTARYRTVKVYHRHATPPSPVRPSGAVHHQLPIKFPGRKLTHKSWFIRKCCPSSSCAGLELRGGRQLSSSWATKLLLLQGKLLEGVGSYNSWLWEGWALSYEVFVLAAQMLGNWQVSDCGLDEFWRLRRIESKAN